MSVAGEPARVLIAVTHLLGSGHLVRAAQLARALAEAGFAVTLASGGMPLRDMTGEAFAFVQLPPVKVEGLDFRNLLDEASTPIEAGRLARRRAMLAALATTLKPDVVVTEHFPFGRRQLAEEFLTLITAAKAANPSALVLASVRDVLVTPRPDRIAEAEQRLSCLFDGVLVHGDRSFLPLEASWPVSPALAARLHYTGYLAPPPVTALASAGGEGAGEVVVSGGGSAAALPLFRLCLGAARLCEPSRRWRILVGQGVAESDFAALRQSASPNVTVERARADFPALLARSALSISQAGYNTVLDLVAAGRPAIVVPFDEGAETEQAIRAEAMEKAGLARCLRLSGPQPARPADLAAAVTAALACEAPARPTIDLDGAGRVAGLLTRLLAARARG
ncbi:MAG TPA: glycosyltransferase [Bosea sp. (in: a-proteobacteria)]|uniref:glycosyltransferase family protein n=1 Tax=Bosea sp. (in: a-proteobacteria) TaxID=1871050 RepID=UPI002DDD4389|nr:glycosyltransferase [Bosea sp. (in: a-proteobacteria)]HEV2554965.1 glycosyltransferase [Bosea sp. (in: a-proteobacteria)]